MLLLSLSGGAGSEVEEVVSPTKAEGLKVSGSVVSQLYQNFNLWRPKTPIFFQAVYLKTPFKHINVQGL